MTRKLLARAGVSLAVVLSYGGLVAVAGRATAATPPQPAAAAPASPPPPADQWPEAHQNPQLTGVSDDPSINTTNVDDLGIKWMANLNAASLTSPIVGYNTQLGETLVYAGSEGGWFSAFDEQTGKVVWSDYLGSAIRVTPTLDGPYVWVADTYSPVLFKINAATGAELCKTPIYAVGEASPIVVTPPGGITTVYMGSNDLVEIGAFYAIDEANCSVEWKFHQYKETTGLWDFISYDVDAPTPAFPDGEPLVVFGTADPDAGIYALDANTGKLVWHFQTYNPDQGPADVGAGVTISPPGNNGFAQGVAYVDSKDGKLYALNLTTGAEIWHYDFESFPPIGNGARDTACLDGDQVVFGSTVGVFDVNAVTGKKIWEHKYPTLPNEALGAPAIAGPPGEQVVYTTDVNGAFQALSLATGKVLYTYQTNNYLASSPAVVSGNVLFTAADGFLYDMGLGGGNTGTPTTAVTSPTQGSVVPNPDTSTTSKPGHLTISGTASDSLGVSHVLVAVQQGGSSGPWWSAEDAAWEPGPFDNNATLASPGGTTTTWTLKVPVPPAGTIIEVRAAAVDTNHLADTSSNLSQSTPARVDFTVAPSTTAPTLQVNPPRAGPGTQVTLTGGGYQPGEKVAVTLPTQPVITLATPTATSTGTLPSTTVTIPLSNPAKPARGIPFGPITVSATGETSGNVGTAPLVISNNWDQFGNTATKDSFEPNDLALTDSVAASGRFYFDQAWNFPTEPPATAPQYAENSPIESSVAIDDGMAFFGDEGGIFYAVNVSTGAPVWTDAPPSQANPESSTIASSGGIDSSAAVDPNLMIDGSAEPAVIFGTEADSSGAGAVVAVNEDTGAPLWTTSTTSGVESSPALYDGAVYVATDDGTFYALNEQTGAIEWTRTLDAPASTGLPQSSPAIDPTHDTVVVGNGDDVTAMNLADGSIRWNEVTGGAVVATPVYFSNNIFVGSKNGTEYAFNGNTGAGVWTYKTGGTITAANVTFGKDIAIGTAGGNGTIDYVTAAPTTPTSGHTSLVNQLTNLGAPIVGLSGAVNFAVATLSNGVAIATRITGIDETWKYYGDGTGFVSAPVLNNGNVYLTGLDTNLYAFSVPGRPVY